MLVVGRIVLTVAAVGYVYGRVDWAQLLGTLRRTDLAQLTAAALLQGCSIAIMAWRWRWLLASHGIHLTPLRSLRLVLTGLFFNLFYLGSVGGDAARFAGALRAARARKLRVALSLVQDRFIGLGALLVLLTAFALMHRRVLAADPAAHYLPIAVPAASAAYLLGVLLLPRLRPPEDREPLPGAAAPPARLATAMRNLVPRRIVVPLLGLSLVIHAITISAGWVAARAVGVDIGISEASVVLGTTALALSLPVTVAGLGVREGALVWLLAIFGFSSPSQALGLSGALLGINLAWAALGAVAFFWPTSDARS